MNYFHQIIVLSKYIVKLEATMNLRSKISEPLNYQSQPQDQINAKIKQWQSGNLRQMMKQNYESYDEQMMPSSISQSHLVSYNPAQNISKGNNEQFHSFLPPTSHIQSESSIQVPDVQVLHRTTPRRRRIFDHDQNSHQNFRKKSNPYTEKNPVFHNKQVFSLEQQVVASVTRQNKNQNNMLRNGGSIGNTPSFGGDSSLMNQKLQPKLTQFRQVTNNFDGNIRKKDQYRADYDFLSHGQVTQSKQSNQIGLNQQINQNRGSRIQNSSNMNMKLINFPETKPYFLQNQTGQPSFHTLASVKKAGEYKNNSSVYDTPNANFNDTSSLQPSISQRNRQPHLYMSNKQTNTVFNNESVNVLCSKPGPSNLDGLKLKNPFLDVDRHFSKFGNEIQQFSEAESQKNGVTQYQRLKQSGTDKRKQIIEGQINILKSISKKSPTPVYENQFYNSIGRANNLPYKQSRANEQNSYQPYYTDPFNRNLNQPPNSKIDKVKDSTFRNNLDPDNKTKISNNLQFFDILTSDIGRNQPIRPDFQPIKNDNTQMLFENFPKPHPLQHRQGMRIDPTQPILQDYVGQVRFVEGRKQSISPFEQSEKQKIKYIPKRFDIIENKVNKQEEQLERLNKKIVESHAQDLISQKKLLNQLIKKEQELSYKQKQINNNLEQMKKLHQQNLVKKQQLIKYQLELQQSKRIQDLYKQNQRLYQQLIRKQSINKLNNSSFNQINLNLEQGIPIALNQPRQQFSSQDLLLSPFALKPSQY